MDLAPFQCLQCLAAYHPSTTGFLGDLPEKSWPSEMTGKPLRQNFVLKGYLATTLL